MSELNVSHFGPIRCEWAYNRRLRLDFCKRHCGLSGAAVCPRASAFREIVQGGAG